MMTAAGAKDFPGKITEIISLSFISVFLLSGGAAAVAYENHTVKLICLGIYVSAAVFFGMLHPEKKAGFIALSLTALTASVSLSGIFNPDLNSTLKTEQVYMFLNIIFIVILLQAAPVKVKKASLIIVLSAAVSVAAGLAQAAFFAAGEGVLFKDYFGGRVYSLFGNPDNFAVFLVFCAPFILQKSGSAGYKFKFILFLLSALSVFLTKSAAGTAVFCAVSAAVLIIQSKDKKKALALAAVIMTAAVLVSVFILNTKKDSVFIRVLLWKASVKMAAAQPLFGVGAANFRVQSPYYQALVYDKDSNNFYKPHDEAYSHNDYLQVLAETGIVGFIFFILALTACVISLYRARSFTALAALSGILAFAFTHFPFNIPYFAVLFFVTAAVFGKDIMA
ncbi:MAG: O-antigen ligase family protein [Candidatus Goldbacteria bacterium]|nr:O-antigen ligase family protein [Candidatus Goldiibacteriota bacterium]